MMNKLNDYKSFCEDLYQSWLQGTANFGDFIGGGFEIDYLPEPYLTFGQGKKKLYVLNYNPGGHLDFQKRDNIKKAYSGQKYHQIAEALANKYRVILAGPPKRRFDNICTFARNLGYDCIENLESFFLHSKNFVARSFLENYGAHDMVKKYTDLLTEYLKDKPVLSVAVVRARPEEGISLQNLQDDGWIKYLCGITSLDLNKAKIIPVTRKEAPSRITSCFVRNGNKYMSVVSGANQIAPINREEIRKWLR